MLDRKPRFSVKTSKSLAQTWLGRTEFFSLAFRTITATT